MKRMIVIYVTLFAVIALGFFWIWQVRYFSKQSDSDVAFAYVEAYIAAVPGETLSVDIPYFTQALRNDPLTGSVQVENRTQESVVPQWMSLPGMDGVAIDSFRFHSVKEEGRLRERVLNLSLSVKTPGNYQADRLLIGFSDGSEKIYPIGDWMFRVLDQATDQELAAEGVKLDSPSSYSLVLNNHGNQAVWINEIEFNRLMIASQSQSLPAGEQLTLSFNEKQLSANENKVHLRMVRPIVRYQVLNEQRVLLPPLASNDYSKMSYNQWQQEYANALETQRALAAEESVRVESVNQNIDRQRRLIENAYLLTGMRSQQIGSVLRSARCDATAIIAWVQSASLEPFDFSYRDGTEMTSEDTRSIWALKMAYMLEYYRLDELFQKDKFDTRSLGDWLLSYADEPIPRDLDLRGASLPESTVSTLESLHSAHVSQMQSQTRSLAHQ